MFWTKTVQRAGKSDNAPPHIMFLWRQNVVRLIAARQHTIAIWLEELNTLKEMTSEWKIVTFL